MSKLELEYKEFGDGESTIIIEIGIGSSFYNWYSLVEKIKQDFRVILYHRAGYGRSQTPRKSRTIQHIAEELNDFVREIGISDKFILMGHSFGGLCAQQYVKMYPSKVKGLILVDSTSFDFNKLYDLDIPVMNSLISVGKMVESNRVISKKSNTELKEIFTNTIDEYKKILPDIDGLVFEEFITNPRLFNTIADEFENWGSSSECIKAMGKFPNIPLKVIARDKELAVKPFIKHGIPEQEAILYEECWRQLQLELSHLSEEGILIIADSSDHDIHIDRPDIIIECLKEFK